MVFLLYAYLINSHSLEVSEKLRWEWQFTSVWEWGVLPFAFTGVPRVIVFGPRFRFIGTGKGSFGLLNTMT